MIDNEPTEFTEEAKFYYLHGTGKPHGLLKILKRGYEISEEDTKAVNNLHTLIKGEDYFLKWCRLRFMVKLKHEALIKLAIKKEKVLFTILSIKIGKPIRFNFHNLLGVLNNALEYYKESGDLIIHALHTYDQFDHVINLDSKEVFVGKVEAYEGNKPEQNRQLEEIIGILFPELNSAINKNEK